MTSCTVWWYDMPFHAMVWKRWKSVNHMLYILCTYGNTIAVLSKSVSPWRWALYSIGIPGHKKSMYLFVCLFVSLENFSLVWRRHHYGWRASILTSTKHSCLLNSEGSSACHTFCVTGHPFIMIISEDPWHEPSVLQWSCHYLFYDAGLQGFEHPTFRIRGECTNCAIAAVKVCANLPFLAIHVQ